jgi:hypothetical protein
LFEGLAQALKRPIPLDASPTPRLPFAQQKTAKQVNMHNKNGNGKKRCQDLVENPSFPKTGPQLFRELRMALTKALGFLPSYPYLGRIVGEEKTLTHYWFEGMEHKHLIAFLSLLERLPEQQRDELIHDYCRELPLLQHSRLNHDPLAVSNLEKLLQLEKGLTWIVGGTDYQKTFVLTALGHSYRQFKGTDSIVAGIDLHEPRKWVPIESLTYFRSPISPVVAKKLVQKSWPEVINAGAKLVLLNGVWAIAPELHPKILAEAHSRHVVLTAGSVPPAVAVDAPISIVTISPRDSEHAIRLRVERA